MSERKHYKIQKADGLTVGIANGMTKNHGAVPGHAGCESSEGNSTMNVGFLIWTKLPFSESFWTCETKPESQPLRNFNTI